MLTININTFDVKMVLIDRGSSSKIMYYSMFEKLKLSASQIRTVDSPASCFSGALAQVLVSLGHVKKNIEVIVMNIDSPYNVILLRG